MSKRKNIKDVLIDKRVTVSKVLLFDPKYKGLSAEAKLFYGYIMDKISLSEYTTQKQLENGHQTSFVDEEGDIFCVITNVEVCEILNCANGKATKTIQELNKVNLIELDRKNNGAYRFYVNEIDVTDIHAESKSRANIKYTLYVNSCKKNEVEPTKDLAQFIEEELGGNSPSTVDASRYHENRDTNEPNGITKIGTPVSRKSGCNYPYMNLDLNILEEEEKAAPASQTDEQNSSQTKEPTKQTITIDDVVTEVKTVLAYFEVINENAIKAAIKRAEFCKQIGTMNVDSMKAYAITVVEQTITKFGKDQPKAKQPGKSSYPSNKKGKPIRTEIVPEWCEPTEPTPPAPVQTKEEIDADRKRLEKELEEFKNRRNKQIV